MTVAVLPKGPGSALPKPKRARRLAALIEISSPCQSRHICHIKHAHINGGGSRSVLGRPGEGYVLLGGNGGDLQGPLSVTPDEIKCVCVGLSQVGKRREQLARSVGFLMLGKSLAHVSRSLAHRLPLSLMTPPQQEDAGRDGHSALHSALDTGLHAPILR
uniref:Uncharacterized protein n=1 Tax=Knipowitschia caucasica TaxID=637954 RepID=A0AAV2KRY4_KNICA